MAIIVKHRRTGNQYILLGINGGSDLTSLPARFLKDLFPREKPQNNSWVTICDVRGNIFSSYRDDLIVVEIDGQKPKEILPEPQIQFFDEEFEDDEERGWQQETEETTSSPEDFAEETQTQLRDGADRFREDEDWI